MARCFYIEYVNGIRESRCAWIHHSSGVHNIIKCQDSATAALFSAVGRWNIIVGRWILIVGRCVIIVGRCVIIVGRCIIIVGRCIMIMSLQLQKERKWNALFVERGNLYHFDRVQDIPFSGTGLREGVDCFPESFYSYIATYADNVTCHYSVRVRGDWINSYIQTHTHKHASFLQVHHTHHEYTHTRTHHTHERAQSGGVR